MRERVIPRRDAKVGLTKMSLVLLGVWQSLLKSFGEIGSNFQQLELLNQLNDFNEKYVALIRIRSGLIVKNHSVG